MVVSNKLAYTKLRSGVDGTLFGNDAFLRLENALCFKAKSRTTTAQPASPTAEDVYILQSTPSGAAWTGKINNVAIWDGTQWIFIPFDSWMVAYVVDEKVRMGYSGDESLWYPLHDIWSATEHWTGKYRGTEKVYSKLVDFGTLPNTGSKNSAHGVSGIDLNYTRAPQITHACISNGTITNQLWSPGTTITALAIDATNVTITTSSNVSSYSAYLRLEYCK